MRISTSDQHLHRRNWKSLCRPSCNSSTMPVSGSLRIQNRPRDRDIAKVLRPGTKRRYCRKKQSRYTPWRRSEGEQYISYSFTTSALDGGEWSASCPGRAFTPGERTPVPIVQESGWVPEPVWTQRLEEKSFAPAEDRTPIARSSSS
jgi:hypothetical protein